MKLLKLTYIAHGWVLGLTDKPLVFQPVEAWKYGPVIRDVYESFKRYGASPVDAPATELSIQGSWSAISAELPSLASSIVHKAWELYRGYSGLELSALTHAEGTPWSTVTKGKRPEEVRDIPIPNRVIRDHYRRLALRSAGNG